MTTVNKPSSNLPSSPPFPFLRLPLEIQDLVVEHVEANSILDLWHLSRVLRRLEDGVTQVHRWKVVNMPPSLSSQESGILEALEQIGGLAENVRELLFTGELPPVADLDNLRIKLPSLRRIQLFANTGNCQPSLRAGRETGQTVIKLWIFQFGARSRRLPFRRSYHLRSGFASLRIHLSSVEYCNVMAALGELGVQIPNWFLSETLERYCGRSHEGRQVWHIRTNASKNFVERLITVCESGGRGQGWNVKVAIGLLAGAERNWLTVVLRGGDDVDPGRDKSVGWLELSSWQDQN